MRPDASPPSSGSIGEDSVRKRSTASVGNVTGSASRIAPSAPAEVGHAGQRAGALLELLDRRVERRRARRRRGSPPTPTPRCRPRSRARGRSRRPRRSRSGSSGARTSCTASSTARAPRGAPPETNTSARSQARRRARARRRRRLERRGPRVGDGRQAGSDADAHARADDTARRCGAGDGHTARPCAGHRRVRPHRRGQDRRRDRARRAAARSAARTRSRCRPTRCRSTTGLPILTGAATHAERARLEHRLLGFVPIDARPSPPARSRERAHAEIDALIAQGRRPIVVGGTGLYLRAALAELDLRPPVDPAIRARWTADRARRSHALHAELPEPRRGGIEPDRPPAHPPRARAARGRPRAAAARERADQLWTTHTRHPDAAGRADRWTATRSHARINARVDAMLAAGAREEVAARRRGRRLGHRAARARLPGAARRRRRGDEDARPAATPSASSRGCASCPARTCRRHRPHPGGRRRRADRHDLTPVRFEKWQALGNDYLIFEEVELTPHAGPAPVRPAFRPGRRRRAGAHAARRAGLRRAPADLQPRRLARPSCRATARARRSSTCAAPAGRDADTFSIQTLAGEIRPTITSPTTCRVDMGRAALTLAQLPGRPAGRPGRTERGGRRSASSTSRSATRSARSASRTPTRSTSTRSARRSSTRRSSPTARTSSFWHELAPDAIRARIFERGVGETLSSGTGASGAAVAHVAARRRLARDRPPGRRRADRRRRRVPARGPDRLGASRSTAAS